MERDVAGFANALSDKEISTHTLTWSVTMAAVGIVGKRGISTHTLTWSVTHGTGLQARRADNFNSHAHVERDLSGLGKCYRELNFNSHAHVERDAGTLNLRGHRCEFQLTRSRGA